MQPSAEKIWNSAQQLLRTMLNTDIYNLWFMPIRATALNGEVITLEVTDDFCEVWLKDNYMGLLQDVVALASGRQLGIKFAVAQKGAAPSAAALAADGFQDAERRGRRGGMG